MALQGTIKDFALPDIFQLIGIQKKTGILTLQNGEDTVTLKFLTGQVVGADTHSMTLEDRIGEVLVRTGRINEEQLQHALRAQKNTLQRLGHILVNAGHLSEEHLVDALRVQSSQIIYRLFRWKEGEYHFDPVEDLDYDQRHFTPISAETILMEGARMIDEWPIIERRVKSGKVVFKLTEAAQGLDLRPDEPAPPLEDDLDFDLGFDLDRPPEAEAPETDAQDGQIKLSPDERHVLAFVDGKRKVEEICDLVVLGEFDTYRLLAELLTRSLIVEAPRTKAKAVEGQRPRILDRLALWLVRGVLVFATLTAVATLPSNPWTPWKVPASDPSTERLRRYASLSRLEKIEQAIQVFYLDAGSLPRSLTTLAQNGYLRPSDLFDPWKRTYAYQLSDGGYQLRGLGASGEPDPDLAISRRFNAVQRMMMTETDPVETR